MADEGRGHRGGGSSRRDYESTRSRDERPRDSRDSRSDRPRNHNRDRSRERDRDRDRYRADDRDRVHKPPRGSHRTGLNHSSGDRTRHRETASPQPPRGPRDPNARFRPTAPNAKTDRSDLDSEVKSRVDDVNMDDLSEDEKMLRIMGFKKFKSTKNTKIPGNEFNYAVRKEKQTKYRQYMNRQGGFNRPLSPS
ncbi:hypothetical protein, variant [Verruconis gallopava]|uniref:U4/U6.U5 small nuclear ribonucleoprotein 27kDa protein domain-containing protein n=1 Tax=Verruconis gallopava TaxID=253628 RepID=A0A0D1XA94_9PEZI|nr:hypothetical protein, variant [Verruconis gallopava]KIV99090.1 hypothetical protein, variant [Verruconis gallopava]